MRLRVKLGIGGSEPERAKAAEFPAGQSASAPVKKVHIGALTVRLGVLRKLCLV